jgi:hypothetical protein
MCLSCKIGVTIGQILILEPQRQGFGWKQEINGRGSAKGGGQSMYNDYIVY